MLERLTFTPYPQPHYAAHEGTRPESATHSPSQNHLLAAMPPDDYERLLPNLKPVPLPLGWTIHGAGDPETGLYFLTAGIAARFCMTANGASAASAVTGKEGVIGVASFLGGISTPCQAVMLSAGYAYRLGAQVLDREFNHDDPLQRLLLRYTQALIMQTMRAGACNRYHSVEQQVCRWILSCIDRLSSNVLTMTQERIAHMLGVRREGVTDAAGKLQAAGLIRTARGRIAILDRRRLEARACQCYAADKRQYDHLFAGNQQFDAAA
jgi:CRP-like cAMP-binding protein